MKNKDILELKGFQEGMEFIEMDRLDELDDESKGKVEELEKNMKALGYAGLYCINRSGRTINVYNVYDNVTIIDYIYHNEVYVFYQEPNPHYTVGNVIILGSNGVLRDGWISFKSPLGYPSPSGTGYGNQNFSESEIQSALYYLYRFPATTQKFAYKFVCQKQCRLIDSNGYYSGKTLNVGDVIYTNNVNAGKSYPYIMELYAYRPSTGNDYACITFNGFIDTGLRTGSGINYFGIRGGW